jgi:hypothetical protein
MDGLVSTGKKFPYTIIKIIFSIIKIFINYFINILIFVVDNGMALFINETFMLLKMILKLAANFSCFNTNYPQRQYLQVLQHIDKILDKIFIYSLNDYGKPFHQHSTTKKFISKLKYLKPKALT